MASSRLIPVCLGLVLVATGCLGSGSDDAARVDHSTAATGVSALADSGPAPGALTPAWHHSAPVHGTTPRAGDLLSGGQLIEGVPHGVDVYDARTGARRWYYREPASDLAGFAETAGVVVVITEVPDAGRSARWTGLDAATGRILWTHDGTGLPESAGTGSTMIAGGGVVPVQTQGQGTEVRGVDARTGNVRWTKSLLTGPCAAPSVRAPSPDQNDGSLFAYAVECAPAHRVVALDPATGGLKWQADVPEFADSITVRAGYTLAGLGDQGFTVLGTDGHVKTPPDSRKSCVDPKCGFEVAGGRAVVSYSGVDDGADGVTFVDLATGRTTDHEITGVFSKAVGAGGRMYGLMEQVTPTPVGDDHPLPAGLDVVDPAAATVQPRPLPFALGQGDVGLGGVQWMDTAGGMLYVADVTRGTRTVTAYSVPKPATPAELGGVSPSDWPDACTIAPGHAPDVPDDPERGDVVIGSTTLHNVSCSFTPGQARLAIRWVASTAAQAQGLLTFAPGASRAELAGADAVVAGSGGGLLVRAGRYILSVDGTDEQNRSLASAAATYLRGR